MAILIRDVREHELDSVLALNNAAGPGVIALDTRRIRHLFDNADYFRVAEVEGHLSGFLVAFTESSDYASTNFQWFRERMERFVYIDRIVVARSRRGIGVGRVLYADVQSYAEVRRPLICCEVFAEGENDPVLLFHGAIGFSESGQHLMPDTGRRALMLAKPLQAYAWVADTYLSQGGLPDEPWLADREKPALAASRATGT